MPRLPRDLLAASSAVIVDTGNDYPSRDGAILEIDGGLTESEWVAQVLSVLAAATQHRPIVVTRTSGVARRARGG